MCPLPADLNRAMRRHHDVVPTPIAGYLSLTALRVGTQIQPREDPELAINMVQFYIVYL